MAWRSACLSSDDPGRVLFGSAIAGPHCGLADDGLYARSCFIHFGLATLFCPLLLPAPFTSLPSKEEAILDHEDHISVLLVARPDSPDGFLELAPLAPALVTLSRDLLRRVLGEGPRSGKRGALFEELVEIAATFVGGVPVSSPVYDISRVFRGRSVEVLLLEVW